MISGSFTDLTCVDFTPVLVLNKSSRGTHLSSSLNHLNQIEPLDFFKSFNQLHLSAYCGTAPTHENSASIYSLRETSNLLSMYTIIVVGALYLTQPENQARSAATRSATIVLASRAPGRLLGTQTLKKQPSGHLKLFGVEYLKIYISSI